MHRSRFLLPALLLVASAGPVQEARADDLPKIRAVSPASATRGQSVDITIEGTQLSPLDDVSTTRDDVSVTVQGLASANKVVVRMTIPDTAAAGTVPLILKTPKGAAKTDRFVIRMRSPVVTKLKPDPVTRGRDTEVSITGTFLYFQGLDTILTVDPPVTAKLLPKSTPTELRVLLTVPRETPAGPRSLGIKTPDGSVSASFSVVLAPPTLTSVTPATVVRGAKAVLTVKGTQLGGAAAPVLAIPDPNVIVEAKGAPTATEWAFAVTTKPEAVPGPRVVVVTTADGFASIPFDVVSPTPPATSVPDPIAGPRGTALEVKLAAPGFAPPFAVRVMPADPAVAIEAGTGPSFRLAAKPDAFPGLRMLVADHPLGTWVTPFRVALRPPSVQGITPSEVGSGHGGRSRPRRARSRGRRRVPRPRGSGRHRDARRGRGESPRGREGGREARSPLPLPPHARRRRDRHLHGEGRCPRRPPELRPRPHAGDAGRGEQLADQRRELEGTCGRDAHPHRDRRGREADPREGGGGDAVGRGRRDLPRRRCSVRGRRAGALHVERDHRRVAHRDAGPSRRLEGERARGRAQCYHGGRPRRRPSPRAGRRGAHGRARAAERERGGSPPRRASRARRPPWPPRPESHAHRSDGRAHLHPHGEDEGRRHRPAPLRHGRRPRGDRHRSGHRRRAGAGRAHGGGQTPRRARWQAPAAAHHEARSRRGAAAPAGVGDGGEREGPRDDAGRHAGGSARAGRRDRSRRRGRSVRSRLDRATPLELDHAGRGGPRRRRHPGRARHRAHGRREGQFRGHRHHRCRPARWDRPRALDPGDGGGGRGTGPRAFFLHGPGGSSDPGGPTLTIR